MCSSDLRVDNSGVGRKVAEGFYANCWGTNFVKIPDCGPGKHDIFTEGHGSATNNGGHVFYSKKAVQDIRYDEEQLLGEDFLLEFQFLKQHPKIERLLFPWDESFPQIQLARKQMKGACGLLTVVIQTKRMEDIVRFCESLQHFLMAVSWGGYESLVIPKCASLSPADFSADNPEHRMVRIYLGLEDAEYLIADLRQALDSF